MKPWDVLGTSTSVAVDGSLIRIGAMEGKEPNDGVLFMCCSSIEQLRSPGLPLGKLPNPLGEINTFVGTGADSSFPDDVLASIKAEGDAAYHRYGYPSSKHVIHVANINIGGQASLQPPQRRLGLTVRSMHRLAATGTLLCLSSGSVTDFEGAAIVNAANEGCVQGAGVDDAINVAGGPPLKDARMALPVCTGIQRRDGGPTEVRCPMGEVRTTIGGNLKASWCIHAVGPNYTVEEKAGTTKEECDELVALTYRRAVEAAKEKNLSSVAFSLVSAGMFRGKQTLQRVLEMGLTGIRDGAYPGLKEVHVVAFTVDEQNALDLAQAHALALPQTEEASEPTGMTREAAIEKLTSAYSNVLSISTQVNKKVLRLSPISDGPCAAHLRSQLPEITAVALDRAVRQLPEVVFQKLPRSVELCIEDPPQRRAYEAAIKEQLKEQLRVQRRAAART